MSEDKSLLSIAQEEREQIVTRLHQWATWRDERNGCDHTSQFNEWCPMCLTEEADDMRAAANLLSSAESQLTALTHERDELGERAERYALEAVDLTRRLMDGEAQLTALRQALARVIPLAEIDYEGVMDQQEYDAIIQNAKLALDGSPTRTGEAL